LSISRGREDKRLTGFFAAGAFLAAGGFLTFGCAGTWTENMALRIQRWSSGFEGGHHARMVAIDLIGGRQDMKVNI
jgi:hypothetical protein